MPTVIVTSFPAAQVASDETSFVVRVYQELADTSLLAG
jgi:hypothetical protein